MKILGINTSHDSGAAIIEDGKIIAAVNEERLNRIKVFWGDPVKSINEVFRISKVNPKDIDFIAYPNITPGGGRHPADFRKTTKRHIAMEILGKTAPWLVGSNQFVDFYRAVYRNFRKPGKTLLQARKLGVEAPFHFIDHHLSHAASAFYTSPYDTDTLVVTTDSSGDGYCCSINIVGKDYMLSPVARTPFFHSPASIYAYITYNLGFKPGHHEGKITGLAAFGKAEKTYSEFKEVMGVNGLQYKISGINYGYAGAAKMHMLMQNKKWEDIAAGLQTRFEEVIVELIKNALKKYPRKNIALAGGAFANVKLNQRIAAIPGVKSIYIHPHMGDGGLGVGSALQLYAEQMANSGKTPRPIFAETMYFGPGYDESEIQTALKKNKVPFKRPSSIESEVASLIAKKFVIGNFDGRMEYGPRALGNRSMLADATDKTINDWLNKRLKRSEFMPFAPVILEERAKEHYRNFDSGSIAANFMTVTFDAIKEDIKRTPAVIHVDGTARPQTINKQQNKRYYSILKEYEKITGIPQFINTSFNMHEEPIVCTPNDAIRASLDGSVDFLAIGPFLCDLTKISRNRR